MVLYDLMNDDDEDIRVIAASATSKILSTGEAASDPYTELLPQAASEKLARILSGQWRGDPYFSLTALKRICPALMTDLCWGSSSVNGKQAFTKTLPQRTQQTSTALFEEERQNLYIDNLREVELWSNVLRVSMPPARDYRERLEDWVLASLRDLNKYLDGEAASGAPLGPTSQLGVFVLFMQVVHLAGLLLYWEHATSSIEEKSAAQTREWDILQAARTLAEVGRRVCIQERILRSLDNVLEGK